MILRIGCRLMLILFPFLSVLPQTGVFVPAVNYGGKQEITDLIKNEMVYPQMAMDNQDEGTVIIEFVVKSDGTPENVHIAKPLNPDIEKEALRIFSFLLWTPAKLEGKNVDDELSLEIDFKIKKYQRNVKQRGYEQIHYLHNPIDMSFRIFEPAELSKLPKPLYSNEGMKFGDFIIQNLKYPDAAKKQGISGTVELFFVIETSGLVTNVKVVHEVGAGCSEEAVRLLKLLKWYPGLKDGMAVRTSMKLSITFNISDMENMKYVPANNSNQI